MSQCNSIEILTNTYSNLNAVLLSDQTKFRLDKINEIKDYFNSEIQERKTMSKKMSKFIGAFDYIDTNLIFLSATSGGISIIFFTSVTGDPVGIASASFSHAFFFNYWNNKEITEDNKK